MCQLKKWQKNIIFCNRWPGRGVAIAHKLVNMANSERILRYLRRYSVK